MGLVTAHAAQARRRIARLPRPLPSWDAGHGIEGHKTASGLNPYCGPRPEQVQSHKGPGHQAVSDGEGPPAPLKGKNDQAAPGAYRQRTAGRESRCGP